MKLVEFFSKPLDIKQNQKEENSISNNIDDDLFWYILDHDRLHKDYFFPIAQKVKKVKQCSPELILELYMPMVTKGCKEYYYSKKMEGKMSKCFPQAMREELCQRLHNHYYNDIVKEKYKLG